MKNKYNKLIQEANENLSLTEEEKKKRIDFINILDKGHKINKAFSNHLDKYINQYKQNGNVQL
jgi:hypothetical protein